MAKNGSAPAPHPAPLLRAVPKPKRRKTPERPWFVVTRECRNADGAVRHDEIFHFSAWNLDDATRIAFGDETTDPVIPKSQHAVCKLTEMA